MLVEAEEFEHNVSVIRELLLKFRRADQSIRHAPCAVAKKIKGF